MKAAKAIQVGASIVCLSCGGSPGRSASEGTTNVPVAAPLNVPSLMTAACTAPTTTDAQRDEGITAFVENRPDDAVRLLEGVAKKNPRDRAAEVFLVASLSKLKDARARASDEQGSLARIPLAPIPLGYVLKQPVDGVSSAKVHLEKVSEAKNLITDVDDWYDKNGLARLRGYGANAQQSHVPETVAGEILRGIFIHADHVAANYEGIIVVSAPGKRPLVFDARDATKQAPVELDVGFAQLVGSTLVVQFAYNGYAQQSRGKNGYFAAYDARTGALLWASEPLVSNAGDAVVSGGSIITGYGFTGEPDFLFALDLATGKVEQKIAVKSGPEVIQTKGDRLFVRTYDMDYVFKSTTGFAPALPAALVAESRTTAPAVDAEHDCWVRRATESIAARDPEGVREASLALAKRSQDLGLRRVLAAEVEHLKGDGRIDLTAAPLVVVPAPPWNAAPAVNKAAGAAPKLVTLSSVKAYPPRARPYDPREPFFVAPVDMGKVPQGAREDIASRYGLEELRAIIPDQARGPDRTILIYGGRYVALVEGSTAERVFDLEAFRHPPKANPATKEYAIQDATYAQERDGALYVCNGGGSYANEVFGKKGFLSALDAKSGALLWRSAPLTCSATFAVVGEHLVTGYGFTNEPDFVFVVRRSDGVVVAKAPLKTAPETITVDGNRVRVDSWGSRTELELRFR